MQNHALISIMLLVRISGQLLGATVLHLKGKLHSAYSLSGKYNVFIYLSLDVNALSGNSLKGQG